MADPQKDLPPEANEPDNVLPISEDEALIDTGQNAIDTRLDEYELKIAELKDQLIRAIAETENVRKRAQRDQEETSKYAITGFARNLVNVLENLQRASSHITPEQRGADAALNTLAEGVELTLRELLNVFERHGITRIDPIGEKFDHQYHQAVVQIPDAKAEQGTILQVLQAGYKIHDRLLQPAMVGVATRGADEPAKLDTQA